MNNRLHRRLYRRLLPGLGLLVLMADLLWGGYYSGTKVVLTSGTPVQLSAATPVPPASCTSLTIQAFAANAGTIYVGGSNVSAANKIGVALSNGSTPPASAYFSPSSSNNLYAPSAIWLDASSSGDGVTYLCYR